MPEADSRARRPRRRSPFMGTCLSAWERQRSRRREELSPRQPVWLLEESGDEGPTLGRGRFKAHGMGYRLRWQHARASDLVTRSGRATGTQAGSQRSVEKELSEFSAV